jgi:hypothetical protein
VSEGNSIHRFDGSPCYQREEVDQKRLYATTNFYVWAEECAKVFPEIDQDTMATWFANAMCTAVDRSDLPKWQEAARLTDEYAGLANLPVNRDPGPQYQGNIAWRPGWSLFDVAHPPGDQYEEDLRVWRQEQERMYSIPEAGTITCDRQPYDQDQELAVTEPYTGGEI